MESQTIRAKFPNNSHTQQSLVRPIINVPLNPNKSLFPLFPSSSSIMPLLTSSSRQPLESIRHRRNTTTSLFSRDSSSKFRARALGSDSSGRRSDVSVNRELIVLNSALTLVLAVANRVLYKLALVPMKEYPFFLALLTTFGYLAIYLSILYARYHAGIVTNEMVAYPKSRFLLIGFLEALGVICGMYAGAMLPGPAIPIISQTFLVWQLTLSVFILGRTYSLNQIAGCLLVAAGVVLAVTSGSDSNQMLAGIAFVWPVLMVASSAFQAAASVIKEFVFIDAASRLKGKALDIFVVNSFGSGFQALFVLLFLPFLSNLKGIPFSELPSFLKSGAGCFFNIGNNISGCEGAPLLPLLYIFTNIAFNISILNLMKISTAVVSSLVVISSVPLSMYLLSMPLPYLPEGSSLSPFFLLGSAVLLIGLILYNIPRTQKRDTEL
ncbi:protein CLT2, chloroplastic [Lycium ferocissimum]|uniref:protein CLT2, chloroplastic n=1 Tax=Lycium ferocissimum TaxID=112874 RepID=UPI002815B65F|nr:protein CLT2, chloroplastic [Lycium ferocissimum]